MAANGVGVPTQVQLSGTGVTQVKGSNYAVTLSLSASGGHASSVSVTAAAKDIAGNDPSYAGSFTWTSYNAAPTGQAGKVATAVAGTVTAVAVGQAVVEAAVPAFDVDGTDNVKFGKVYALLNVQVVP